MLDVQLLAAKVYRTFRKDGLFGLLAGARKRIFPRRFVDDFDAVNGTDTAQPVRLWQLKIPFASARFGACYQSVEESRVRTALASIPRSCTSFVDLGCGKGKPLIIASRMGFSRVIGVEFSPTLAAVARKNVEITGTQAEIVEGDAGEYHFAAGPVCIYLYSPFGIEIMRKVAENIRRHSGETWVVYLNPHTSPGCAELFDGFMERKEDKPGVFVWRTEPFPAR